MSLVLERIGFKKGHKGAAVSHLFAINLTLPDSLCRVGEVECSSLSLVFQLPYITRQLMS